MTYVSRTDFAIPAESSSAVFSLSATAGDVLLAFLHLQYADTRAGRALSIDRLSVPEGWLKLGMWTAWPTFVYGTMGGAYDVLMMAWCQVKSSGTVSGAFGLDGQWWPCETGGATAGGRILRFSGMRAIQVAASRMNAQQFTYPAIAGRAAAAAGHAVRVAVRAEKQGTGDLTPSGHTSRILDRLTTRYSTPQTESWVEVSEQALTGVLPSSVQSATSTRDSGFALTLYIASTQGPERPTVLSPLSGSRLDLTKGFDIAWVPAGEQSGVGITRKLLPSGATEYLTLSGTWTTTPTTIPTTATTRSIAGAGFTAGGSAWLLTVATTGTGAYTDLGDVAQSQVISWASPTATGVTYQGVSSGTVSGPTGRAGVLAGAGTAGSGATLDQVEVWMVDGDGQEQARGTHSPGGSHQVGGIPNGSYTLWSRVRQGGNQWSTLVSAGPVVVAVPVPPAPSLTVTATTHPASGLPGAKVALVGAVPMGQAWTAALYRDGQQLGAWPIHDSGLLTIDDHTLPPGGAVSYTATLTDAASPPNTSTTSPPTAFTLAIPGAMQWLFDPINPAGAIRVLLQGVGDITHDPRVAVHQPLDSPGWITRSLGRVLPAGSLRLAVQERADWGPVVTLLTSGRRLMLWYQDSTLETSPQHAEAVAFRVAGAVTEQGRDSPLPWRIYNFPYVTD